MIHAKTTAAPVRTVHRTVTTQIAHVAATGAAAPVAAKVAITPSAPASQSTVKPVVDVNSSPAPTTTAANPTRTQPDKTTVELGAGALALLALGGGAWILSRRRRRRDEEFAEEAYAYEPVEATPVEAAPAATTSQEQPAIVASSAFAWGNEQPAAKPDDDSDRRPGESWVERAYRGPSPANPSVSLRTRLKRAAFFDKREREVAAGTAEPVETDAGLPEAMSDEPEREVA